MQQGTIIVNEHKVVVTFMKDRHEKAIEIVEMLDRLAVRSIPDDGGQKLVEAPAVAVDLGA